MTRAISRMFDGEDLLFRDGILLLSFATFPFEIPCEQHECFSRAVMVFSLGWRFTRIER